MGKKCSFLCKIFSLFLPCNWVAVQNLYGQTLAWKQKQRYGRPGTFNLSPTHSQPPFPLLFLCIHLSVPYSPSRGRTQQGNGCSGNFMINRQVMSSRQTTSLVYRKCSHLIERYNLFTHMVLYFYSKCSRGRRSWWTVSVWHQGHHQLWRYDHVAVPQPNQEFLQNKRQVFPLGHADLPPEVWLVDFQWIQTWPCLL